MIPMIRSNLRYRLGRTVALLAALLLATSSFVVLTGTADTSRLEVVGTVHDNVRSAYDILVRPAGAATAMERSDGLVQPNYLANSPAGITLAQYHTIRDLAGVDVAAPIAVVGYVLQTVEVPIDLTGYLTAATQQAFRIAVTRHTDRGLSTMADQTSYVYVTRNPVQLRTVTGDTGSAATQFELVPGGQAKPLCPEDVTTQPVAPPGPFDAQNRVSVSCTSTTSGSTLADATYPPGHVVGTVRVTYPFLLAAVDPAAEARLAHVDQAIDSGRYLQPADTLRPHRWPSGKSSPTVPVVISDVPYTDDQLTVSVEALDVNPGVVADAATATPAAAALASARAHQVGTSSLDPAAELHRLIGQMAQPGIMSDAGFVSQYWSASPATYQQTGPRRLSPQTVTVPDSTWAAAYYGTGWVPFLPLDAADTALRQLTAHTPQPGASAEHIALLDAVGTIDPRRISKPSALSAVPLAAYDPPQAAPDDQDTTARLHAQDLLPNANPAGYLQAPPLMLTTLGALPAFADPVAYGDAAARDAKAPITAIRVRAAGVTGVDPLSRERIRLLAQQIYAATGLDVDVTIGSSPSPVSVQLPAGRFGRPPLALQESWVHKGVALAILQALDRKSVALLALILAVCALFITNAAGAAVRTRRGEYGLLAALGWPRRTVYAYAMAELAVVGLGAGIGSAGLALLAGRLTGAHVSVQRALLALPAALLLAALAGAWPALRASASAPAHAMTVGEAPPQTRTRRRRHRSATAPSVLRLALRSPRRAPGRAALGALPVAVATAALALILAITQVFHGVVVGSLLGDAVAVEVRTPDIVAVVAIVVLGAFGVADILYLNVQERLYEYTVLRAIGWPERAISRLVIAEGAAIGLPGALVGAGIGVAGAAMLTHSISLRLALPAILAALVCQGLATAACYVPVLLLRRVDAARLLSRE